MKRVLTHFAFWGIILFWSSSIYDYNGKFGWHFVYFNAIRLPLIMAATYFVVYYLVPKFLIREKRYWHFAGLFLLNFLIVTILDRFLIGTTLMDKVLAPTKLTYTFFNEIPIFRNAFLLLSIIGLAALIHFFKLFLAEEKQRHALLEENLATKLAFLKAQVNPHFLFNALNNLYSMSIQKQQVEIATGLENLSGIMHYLTYESGADRVPLEKEVQLLQNYMEIQQLRLADTDDTTLSFTIEGDLAGIQIAPVILLPLVENAFKHGVKPEQKCLVHIRLAAKKHHLDFSVKNTFFSDSEENPSKGVGLQNVRKRLQLVYPEKHYFQIEQMDTYFLAVLQIQLD